MYKIAIVGPESTGKSELAGALASYFEGEWVPEYAREYVEGLGRPYNYDDVCAIAHRQIEDMHRITNNKEADFVFFDTELIITKVWFEYCYQQVPDFLLQAMHDYPFDFYLLCNYDLDWIPDPVREHGDDRADFFEIYRQEIEKTAKPYAVISGFGEARTQHAVEAIRLWLET